MSDKYLYHFSAIENTAQGVRYFHGSAELCDKVMTQDDHNSLVDEIRKDTNANEAVILNLTLLHEPAKL